MRRVFVIIFFALSLAVYSQQAPSTSSLFDQVDSELANLEQNSKQLQTIIDNLKSQSEADKLLLTEQATSLQVAMIRSQSLELSLNLLEKLNKAQKYVIGGLIGAIAIETAYLIIHK